MEGNATKSKTATTDVEESKAKCDTPQLTSAKKDEIDHNLFIGDSPGLSTSSPLSDKRKLDNFIKLASEISFHSCEFSRTVFSGRKRFESPKVVRTNSLQFNAEEVIYLC